MEMFLSLSDFLKEHWLFLSFLAPILWAVVNIIDVYFVKEVYEDALDGTIMSGLFQIIPWIVLIFFFSFQDFASLFTKVGGYNIKPDILIVYALVGGFLFVSSFYFYFKALFEHNDSPLVQIIWGLTIIIVPLTAFVLGTEKLALGKYFGMAIIFLGVILLSLNNKIRAKFSWHYTKIMLMAVFLLSFSMLFEEAAYSAITSRGFFDQGFLIIFSLFSLGAFFAGVFFSILGKRNPVKLIKKYWKVFLVAEGISFLGTLASQRSIDIAPSVSYVAAVETFVPVFIMIFSVFILFYYKKIAKINNEVVKIIYREQLDGIWTKILATIVMAVGIYLMS